MLTKNDLNLVATIEKFLLEKCKEYGGGSLWNWALKAPHTHRLEELFATSGDLQAFLTSKNGSGSISVLDLGCGFCTYWPILQARGCNKFVGIDLFRLRGEGDQAYQKTAVEVAENFCSDSECYVLEGDVRDIDKLFELYGVNQKQKFDIIFTKNTDYTKLGSTGIPQEIFDDICSRWLKADGKKIYAG